MLSWGDVTGPRIFVWELKAGDRVVEHIGGALRGCTVLTDPVEDDSDNWAGAESYQGNNPGYFTCDVEWETGNRFPALGQAKHAPEMGPVLYRRKESFTDAKEEE